MATSEQPAQSRADAGRRLGRARHPQRPRARPASAAGGDRPQPQRQDGVHHQHGAPSARRPWPALPGRRCTRAAISAPGWWASIGPDRLPLSRASMPISRRQPPRWPQATDRLATLRAGARLPHQAAWCCARCSRSQHLTAGDHRLSRRMAARSAAAGAELRAVLARRHRPGGAAGAARRPRPDGASALRGLRPRRPPRTRAAIAALAELFRQLSAPLPSRARAQPGPARPLHQPRRPRRLARCCSSARCRPARSGSAATVHAWPSGSSATARRSCAASTRSISAASTARSCWSTCSARSTPARPISPTPRSRWRMILEELPLRQRRPARAPVRAADRPPAVRGQQGRPCRAQPACRAQAAPRADDPARPPARRATRASRPRC